MLTTKNMDMKMRRVVDASPAKDPNDYVILQQLTDVQNTLQQNIDNIKVPSSTGLSANSLLYAQANNSLTLTTTPQNIPGLTFSINRGGTWLIIATIAFQQGGIGDSGFAFVAQVNIGGTGTGPQAAFFVPSAVGFSTSQSGASTATQFLYNATSIPQAVTVTAYKTGGTGNSSTLIQSTVSALWVN